MEENKFNGNSFQAREDTSFERFPIHWHERLFRSDNLWYRGRVSEFDFRPGNLGLCHDHCPDPGLDNSNVSLALFTTIGEHSRRRENRSCRPESRLKDRMQHKEIRHGR